ncbi:MAG: hypothetical protein CSB15_01900 [Clostridiales bacterium]|nr:MAG: hypothetical protein CSB15_01900 [Clostridiales bacterium]
MNLYEIIKNNKHTLGKHEKAFSPLWKKISNFGYYANNNSNYLKLEKFATPETIDFLFMCIDEYNQTKRVWSEHHDSRVLDIVWHVLAFSDEMRINNYFESIVDENIQNINIFLQNFHDIGQKYKSKYFLYEKIQKYYDEKVIPHMASTKLCENLNLQTPEYYYFSFIVSTDGEWIYTNYDTDEERKNRYCLNVSVYGKNPRIYNESYSISFYNKAKKHEDKVDISFRDGQDIDKNCFIYGGKNCVSIPNLLDLSSFISELESNYKIKLNFEKIAYISTVKGVKRKTISDWVKRRFVFV